MKANVIFHSVCGNTYIMAKMIHEKLKGQGIDSSILRVQDENIDNIAGMFEVAREHLDEIKAVPVARAKDALDCDYIFMGCPTYFGNVSGQMKLYMDSLCDFWVDAKLYGTKLMSFTTCGTPEGGGDFCLGAINTFAHHMGMIPMPVPSNLMPRKSLPAYGLIHYTGELSDLRPREDTEKAISAIVEMIVAGSI